MCVTTSALQFYQSDNQNIRCHHNQSLKITSNTANVTLPVNYR